MCLKKKTDFTEHGNKKQCQIKGKRKKHQNEELSEREKCHVEMKEILKVGVKKNPPSLSI